MNTDIELTINIYCSYLQYNFYKWMIYYSKRVDVKAVWSFVLHQTKTGLSKRPNFVRFGMSEYMLTWN